MDDFAWLESTPLSCFVCFDMVVQQVGIWPAVIIPKGSFWEPNPAWSNSEKMACYLAVTERLCDTVS